MTNLQEMLKSAHVEWKKLGEVCAVSKGQQFNKKDMLENGKYPVINGGTSPSGYVDVFSNDKNIITVSQGGASAGFVNFIETKFWLGAHAFSVIPHQEIVKQYNYTYHCFNRFVFHLLKSKQEELMASQYGAGIPSLKKENVLNIEIPMVSFQVQIEIVRILDAFTELSDMLATELILRKKQYAYYLEKLLSEEGLKKCARVLGEDDSIRWAALGEVGEIQMCKRILKNQTEDTGDVPFYKIGTFGKVANSFISRDLFNEYKNKYNYPKKGEVLISASGTIGRTVIFDGKDAYFQDSNIVWISHDESIVLNKYLYYFYKIVAWPQSEGGTINRLYNYNLLKMQILIPPPKVQSYVAGMLDKFSELIEETEGALPAEIAMRKKQYEYYRDVLLKFEK